MPNGGFGPAKSLRKQAAEKSLGGEFASVTVP